MDQPHYSVSDIAELEQRIEAQLDLLMSSPELGWKASEAWLDQQQPGETFAAAVIALRSHDIGKIQIAIQSSLTSPAMMKGVVSALGWLPADTSRPWIERLLKGKDMNHKYLGIAAASVRREDPGDVLTDILKRDDCRQHQLLHARALRIVGELRRQDLMPILQSNLTAKDAAAAFWAAWSVILLGQHSLVSALRPYVLQPGPLQSRAIQLAFRVLPVEQAREWISALAQNPDNVRSVIRATGILGDPHAVNWLISKMPDLKLARLAGEAFSCITGVDVEKHGLILPILAGHEPVPNENSADTADTYVGLDEDENLPWPDASKIATLWRNHGQHFLVGRRYFLGKSITPDWLKNRIQEGSQRQRHAAALELALIDTQSRLINTRARVTA